MSGNQIKYDITRKCLCFVKTEERDDEMMQVQMYPDVYLRVWMRRWNVRRGIKPNVVSALGGLRNACGYRDLLKVVATKR